MASVELRPFTIDEFHRRRRRRQRTRHIATAVMGLAAALATVGGLLRVASSDREDRTITTDEVAGPGLLPPSPFVGSWESIDADGSRQTLEIRPAGNDDYEMVLRDDAAGPCSETPSTEAGTGQISAAGTLVVYGTLTCDDPATGVAEGVAPPDGQPTSLVFSHDPVADELLDDSGVVWQRSGTTRGEASEDR